MIKIDTLEIEEEVPFDIEYCMDIIKQYYLLCYNLENPKIWEEFKQRSAIKRRFSDIELEDNKKDILKKTKYFREEFLGECLLSSLTRLSDYGYTQEDINNYINNWYNE